MQEWGFDDTPNPSWFMVPHNPGASKLLRLAFGQGKTVKSVNPRICTIRPSLPDPADPDGTYFWFTGNSPGNTRVEVRSASGKVPETVLAVSVFTPRSISVVFHFVEDRSGNRTTRQPGSCRGWLAVSTVSSRTRPPSPSRRGSRATRSRCLSTSSMRCMRGGISRIRSWDRTGAS
jgi:hypothetical protein